jgi:hypothetical protein
MLYLADYQGRALQVSPEDVVYTNRQVASGPLVVSYQVGLGQSLFPPVHFEQEIHPLLERAQKIGEVNMAIYQIIKRNPLQLWLLGLTVIGILLICVFFGWRPWC